MIFDIWMIFDLPTSALQMGGREGSNEYSKVFTKFKDNRPTFHTFFFFSNVTQYNFSSWREMYNKIEKCSRFQVDYLNISVT